MKKKKSLMRMNRRTFVCVILGICAVALLTEGILLARTFSKKKREGTKTVTPEAENVLSGTPTLTPTAEPKPEKQTVWRIVGQERDFGSGISTIAKYDYDEQGRQVRESWEYDTGTESFIEAIYEKSGVRTLRWLIMEGNIKEDDNYYELEAWGYPLEPYDNEFFFYKADEDPAFEITYDENGYWKEIKAKGEEGARFTYDDTGRMTSCEQWTRYGGTDEEPVYMQKTLNLTYDDDGKSITAIQVISSPGRRLSYELAFEDGKIIKNSVSMNGTKLEDREWTYMKEGTRIHTTSYIDTETIQETETWKIPLQIPQISRPGSFDTLDIEITCGDEMFTVDKNGRVDGVIKADATDRASKVKKVEYDEDVRVTWFAGDVVEYRYSYDENGILKGYEGWQNGELYFTAEVQSAAMEIEVSDDEPKQ